MAAVDVADGSGIKSEPGSMQRRIKRSLHRVSHDHHPVNQQQRSEAKPARGGGSGQTDDRDIAEMSAFIYGLFTYLSRRERDVINFSTSP